MRKDDDHRDHRDKDDDSYSDKNDNDDNNDQINSLNLETTNQKENFKKIEELQIKMKEENKNEIRLINNNFRKIEEGAMHYKDRDINTLMKNYKNLINMSMKNDKESENNDAELNVDNEVYNKGHKIKVNDVKNEFQFFLKNQTNLNNNKKNLINILKKEKDSEKLNEIMLNSSNNLDYNNTTNSNIFNSSFKDILIFIDYLKNKEIKFATDEIIALIN